ncbi:LuxR C-terminal-related transcriptional regulator [Paenibacillus sp. MBLB4367]|uniref:LuxR C-terminal-related transcriptional regulator n=1 Tax=Paenibacillus sp. MBLB4367 TaxID=3384767 RepID=UPI00390813F0
MVPHDPLDPEYGETPETIERLIERLSETGFVGRSFELHYFDAFMSRPSDRPERILNLYGTGGMGKTLLLEQLRRRSAHYGALFVQIDVRDYGHTPETLVTPLADRFGIRGEGGEPPIYVRCLEAVNRIAAVQRVVLAFDHFEEIGSMDQWLRESFFPKLRADVLLVIAGRFPLEGPWRFSTSWRKLIVPLPLSELSYEETRAFLQREGIADEAAIDAIWVKTLGHPLSLSLCSLPRAFDRSWPRPLLAAEASRDEPEFEALLEEWLREAPDDELRELLLAASVPRSFNQELLASIAELEIAPSLFERLTRLSFVGRSARGWHLHERIRESLRAAFRRRKPEAFERMCSKSADVMHAKIGTALLRKEDVSWEVAELLRQSGNPILRAHFRHSRHSSNYLESVTPVNAHEAEAYIQRRKSQPKASKIRCSDAESGSLFRYSLSAEEGLLRLAGLPIRELLALDIDAVKLLRSREGLVVGLSAVVPIHEGTLDFLTRSPISRAYFRSLTPQQLQALRVPNGQQTALYIMGIDVEDLEKEELRSDIVHVMLGFILSGRLLIASPPPLAYYRDAHLGYGFDPLPGASHQDYDGRTPTATYVLDTRKEKLPAFVAKMAGAPAAAAPARQPEEPVWLPELTPREKEAARLLVRGHTNREIAAALYISEAAVKKHVNAILQKFGLKNRTQLAGAIIGQTPVPD